MDGDRCAALIGDRVDGPLSGDVVDVAAYHRAATVGEFEGERRPDSAAGAGHHGSCPVARLRLAPQPEHLHPTLSPASAANAVVMNRAA